MAQPRYTQIDVDATPYYHCISRCVRRAFLCGHDRLTGRNFDHRKAWVVEKLAELTEIFAIRICAYAVLSNHFHLVLRIDAERARAWSDGEIVERYGRLFRHTAEHWQQLPPSRAADRVACWRARLSDPSWFMRCLNESIARRANREDGCTGRFWEGRFRSQALLDEAGLLTCMSYVDLNPIRAGMAGSLEESDFTSIQQRLEEQAREQDLPPPVSEGSNPTNGPRRPELAGFAAHGQSQGEEVLPLDPRRLCRPARRHRGGGAQRGAESGASRSHCTDSGAARHPQRALARVAARLSAPILLDGRLRAQDRRLLCAYRPPPCEGQRLGGPGVPQLRLTPAAAAATAGSHRDRLTPTGAPAH